MIVGNSMLQAPTAAARVPVSVNLVGDDGLTQNLHVSLEHGLRKHPNLRLATAEERAALSIQSDTNVRWDELGGRKVVIYTVYVSKGDYRGSPTSGVCFERQMSKCVKDILRLVRISANRG